MKTGGSPLNIHKVRKVRRQRRPGYPTRPEVVRDPELLRRHVPSAWKKSAQVTAALSILLAAGCRNDAGSKAQTAANVAPLFEHGEGRGSDGCVVVTPPRFLSEQEALGLISDELAKAGLSMSQLHVKMEPITISNKHVSAPLTVDLVDPQKKVAIVCVTSDKYFELGGDYSESTVQRYDCRKVAERVGMDIRAANNAPKMFYGLFYDPIVRAKDPESREYGPPVGQWMESFKRDPNWSQAELEKQVETLAKQGVSEWTRRREQAAKDTWDEAQKLLRAQVRDFIEWLKGQGAI
jgi:hypothetical protein